MDFDQEISTIASVVSLIAVIFAFADLLFSNKEKDALQRILMSGWYLIHGSPVETNLAKAALNIITAFDIIYGKKRFSLRSFIGSAFVSFIFTLFMVLIFSKSIQYYYIPSHYKFSSTSILASFIGAFFFSVFVDYLSVVKSRYILGISMKVKARYHIILVMLDVLLTDMFLSSIIVALGFIANPHEIIEHYVNTYHVIQNDQFITKRVAEWAYILVQPFEFPLFFVYQLLNQYGNERHGTPAIGICMLSAFSTSVIFVVYYLVSFFGIAIGTLRERSLVLLENAIDNKYLFSFIGIIISSVIITIKVVVWVIWYCDVNLT